MAASGRATTGRMTIAEYAALPADPAYRHELSRGRLVREPRPGGSHGATAALIAHHLVMYALEHGGVVTTETGFVLDEKSETLRGPDVAYLRVAPEPHGLSDAFIQGPPDLAVEVVSPSNAAADLQEKVLEYFDSGCAEVWVVHPRTRTVVVHASASETHTLAMDDVITGGDVLPGLELAVADLFRF